MLSKFSRVYFDTFLKPNYEAWLADGNDLRRAMNAALSSNHMADWCFGELKQLSEFGSVGVSNVKERREYLTKYKCPDFGLIRDIADAYKHLELDRGSRKLTSAGQTSKGSLGWGEGGWGEGVWGGGPQIVVRLDNGQKRAFSAPMSNVFNMWDEIVQKHFP